MTIFNEVSQRIASIFNQDSADVDVTDNDVTSWRDVIDVAPFYTCLCYESYDKDSAIFHNKQSHAFVLMGSPLMGGGEDTVDILHSMLIENLPTGSTAEIMLWGSPKIAPAIEAFYRVRSARGGIYEKLAKARQQYLLHGAYQSLIDGGHYLVRDFQVFITVSLKKSSSSHNTLITVRDNLLYSAKSINMTLTPLDAGGFLSVVRDLVNLNDDTMPADPTWNPYDALNRQVTDPDMTMTITPTQVNVNQDAWQIRCLTPLRYPKQWSQWAMTDLIGDLFKEPRRIPCPFLLKLSIQMLDQDKSAKKTAFKGARADQLASSHIARFMPRAKKISADWQFVSERIDEGDRLVRVMFQVILHAPKAIADRCESTTKDIFLSKGWRLKKPHHIQFPLWLASLPMMMGDGVMDDLRYWNVVKTKLGYNAVNMAPLQGEWKGVRKPLLTLVGRRGQMMWWDMYENNEGNYNVAVAGKSGSGKSVFLQEIEMAVVGAGGRVFKIDVGRSSERTCRLIGGDFIEFTQESTISVNPFTHIKAIKESLPMLKPMFSLMAAPSRKTDDFENAILEQAIMAAWERYDNDTDVTAVADQLLQERDQRAKDLGTMLYPYTNKGSFGRFFNGKCTLNFDNPYINLELEELKSKKDLQEVILYMLMYQVTEVMYRGDRKTRVLCVIDEAWDIFRNDQGGEFIETGYRRARKYEGSFISGSQGVNDYYKNAATRAAIENSDWLALLSQTPESIQQLKRDQRLSLDGHLERLLNSVKTSQGEYSEIFIKGPQCHAVGRLFLDPFSRLLKTSKGDEYAAIETLMQQGLSVSDAIERLLTMNRQ